MGMQTIETYGIFSKMDKQSVLGFLKSCGSRDPDVLALQKQKLLTLNRNLKLGGWGAILFGVLMIVTVIFFIIGIPVILLGVWMLWLRKKNIAVIESTYNEYLASPPA